MASATPLNKLAMNGAFWSLLGYGFSNTLRFAGNLVLTRLLAPELFGLMALTTTFLTGLSLFSDVGITPSIIQSKRGADPSFLNTAWTIQAIRGIVIWFACCAIAYPAAQFYQEPRITWLLPIVGLTTIISGFASTSISSLKRDLFISKTVILEIVGQAITLTIMIIWALFSENIWALIVGNIASAIIRTVASFLIIRGYKNKFQWDPTAVHELFTFGRWIFLSTALTFLAMQGDRLIVGKIVSIEMLGVYSICIALAELPRQVVGRLGQDVIFPVISRATGSPREEVRQKFLKKRWLLLIGSLFLAVLLVSAGDLLIEFLYDSRYSQGSWILSILALGFWHTVLYDTMSPCLLGLGKPVYATAGYFLRFLVLMLGVPLAFQLGGFVAAVIVIAFHDLPMYVVIAYGSVREKMSSLQQDFYATLIFIAVLAGSLALRYSLGFGLPLLRVL